MQGVPSKISITSAICTFNGADRLPEVLAALAQQSLAPETWEILLVDNGSTDATKKVFSAFAGGHPHINCNYQFEPEPGQSAARRRAMAEARGGWLCFVDDDNVLDLNYLSESLRFIADKPHLGVLGGRSVERIDTPMPRWFPVLKDGLAIWDGGGIPRILSRSERCFTAGLVVRTDIARRVAAEKWVLTGRTASMPIGGEDLELCLKVESHGFERWYNPRLCFSHVLPFSRYQLNSLSRLFETFGATHLLLYPVYRPFLNSKLMSFAKILFVALLKYPLYFAAFSVNRSDSRWSIAKKMWSYKGVIKYSFYGWRILNSTGDFHGKP
jgi:glycosyltransferase involved in cell wall biosynthesis